MSVFPDIVRSKATGNPIPIEKDLRKFFKFGTVAEMRDQAIMTCCHIRAFVTANCGSGAAGYVLLYARWTAETAMSGRRNEKATTIWHLRANGAWMDQDNWTTSSQVKISVNMSIAVMTFQRVV